MRKNLFIFFILFSYLSITCQSVFIVIHGTWGANGEWYVPGGDFFDALEKTAQQHNALVVPFRWSGSHRHEERERAARNLVKLICSYTFNNIEVNIIGHSHGGTVALLASRMLEDNSINILYTLGMPINEQLFPNMNAMRHCYNLFSFEDLIQPVLGMFEREHISHERVANVRVIIERKEPNHTDLHHPLIGKWLPTVHTTCLLYLKNNRKKNMSDPGVINFYNTTLPTYEIDRERKELLEKDNQLSVLILNSLRQSLDMGSRMPLTKR